MRTIGLVGGTSWVSTVEYYRIINQQANLRRGGNFAARIVLASIDFGDLSALQARGDFDAVGAMLVDAARRVEGAGAECVLLCANTTHMHADRVAAALSVPLVHLIDAVAAEIRRRGLATVGLLGTRFTMERGFYAERLARHGVKVLTPEPEDRAFVQQAIDNELVKSQFRPETRARFLEMMDRLRAAGAEGVILGCTEIPLLIPPADCPMPAFDTTSIHAMAAVDWALAPEPVSSPALQAR